MKTLAQLEQDAQDLAAQIKILKEKEEQTVNGPWEPYGVDRHDPCYRVTPAEVIWHTNAAQCSTVAKAGVLFQTKEAAEKASKFFTFYQRLYQLALECNAKHKPTNHYLFGASLFADPDRYTVTSQNRGNQYTDQLFTSRKAAQEACDIMNRDKWITPIM